MQQRFSPRINNLSDQKRPHYGNVQELLDSPTEQGQRVSPRLRNIPDCKKPYYGSGSKKPLEIQNNVRKKKFKVDYLVEICQLNRAREFEEDEVYNSDVGMGSVPIENAERGVVNSEDDEFKWTGSGNGLLGKLRKSTFLKVKETFRLLNLHYLRNFQVVNCRADKDVSRYSGFQYSLRRLREQPKRASKDEVCFIRGQVSKVSHVSPGLVCMDISCGEEDICIPATNVIDNPPVAPSGFTYIKSIQVAKNVIVPPNASGCNCKGSCTNPKSCSCAQLNGFNFPYVHQDGGRLIEAKDVVFECGPGCGCGPGCVNRTTQRRLKYGLEVYRTKDKGWAVRSLDFIPSGAPVCEYTGVLRRTDDLDSVSDNDFIFEIDCWQTMNEIGQRERRFCNVSVPLSNLVKKAIDKFVPEFCIDAGLYGNVARFINHSCEPNLFVQCVLSSHHDIRLARLVLFAADDIPPMQELTYDYGYELDSVVSPDGRMKKLPCNCGTADCRKRLY